MPIAMARHILVKTKEEAEKLKQRLAGGEDFDKLAKKYSTCNSAKKGGDLGEVKPGQMVKSIDNVIFKKPVNKVQGPIKSKFGYHLVVVYFRD
ncbi:MAG: peptidylprolyl isomerase [Gammaproteobacteria bacterium]|nr:peptidylprolyl isomerase [Gammaproteobacteria bacterium]